MSKIEASGETFFGQNKVTITGKKNVDRIECNAPVFEEYIRLAIKRRRGQIANAYHPPANSMLQAYALLVELFGEDNVTVEGDIGELEHEPGRIY